MNNLVFCAIIAISKTKERLVIMDRKNTPSDDLQKKIFAKNLNFYITKSGKQQNEIAKDLGFPPTTFNTWCVGKVMPKMGKVQALVDYFGILKSDLLEEKNKEDSASISNLIPITTHKLPMLGEIACGEPRFTNENRESYVDAGTDIKADFCLKAKGDSMINARIHDGDIVFIHRQDIVENGEIAAVVVNHDSEATLKRFFYYRERATLILKPENPAYEDLIFQNEELNEVHVLGKAIAFQSDVK